MTIDTVDEILSKFMNNLGMTEQKARETIKNTNVTNNLLAALKECDSLQRGVAHEDGPNSGVGSTSTSTTGMLLYHLASKIKPQIGHHLPFLVNYIQSKKLDSSVRVEAALEYLLTKVGQQSTNGHEIDTIELDRVCGVGITVTPDQIDRAVDNLIQKNRSELLSQRYRFNIGKIMQEVRAELPWADGKHIKNEVEVQIFDLLGKKTEDDLKPPVKADKKSKDKKVAQNSAPQNTSINGKLEEQTMTTTTTSMSDCGASSIAELMRTKVHFHRPGENYKTDGYVITENTERLLKAHLAATGGQVHTRFPPEPNGILHIGHAKAININFGYAAANGGKCFLRYDDTNPEKEEEKFFVAIKDMVEWLGYTADKITHSSDNFQQLYEWAIVLIKTGNAYVCHQTADEMKGFNPQPSMWRDRPIAESLQLFEDMKNGKIDEGAATLRMKVTLEEGKMDPVAYRIKFIEHHRTKTAWCIYPTYDYTHCLCDSIENITHSLCTKEFQSRRSSYYWLCNALQIYCPVQWEYGRLNVNYTVVSKRKIGKLITEGWVADWDDPRLFTLTALRRRGFPAEAINKFCAQIGVTGAQGSVDPAMLEAAVRDYLNERAPRTLVVIQPIRIQLTNFPFDGAQTVSVPDFPGNPDKGSHTVVFDRHLYIERSDFKEDQLSEKGYRRLTPNQTVGLRHTGFIIKINEIIKNPDGLVIELLCSCIAATDPNLLAGDKPKAFIQWISKPIEIEVRLYETLFLHKNPEDVNEVPGGFLTDCNPNSLTILKAYADESIRLNAKPYDNYQFERIGFFSVDPDTKLDAGRLVFNRTVTLKEDSGKN